MLRYLPFFLYVLLAAYCVADAVQHRDHEPYGLPKWAWVLIVLFFPYIGAAAWLFLKFWPRDNGRQYQAPRAPDDDPEYLAWLRDRDQRRRRN